MGVVAAVAMDAVAGTDAVVTDAAAGTDAVAGTADAIVNANRDLSVLSNWDCCRISALRILFFHVIHFYYSLRKRDEKKKKKFN